MIRPSASSVGRLLACAGSAHLQQHDYKSAYADAGVERHEGIEAATEAGEVSDDIHPKIVALYPAGAQQAAEAAFAYDVATDTARALGHVNRKYVGLSPYEMPGTVDLVVLGAGRALVIDHKSYEEVEPAATNPQLATYALMVARSAKLDEVTVAVNYKLRAPDIAVLDTFDLDAHAARLKKLHVDVAAAQRNPTAALRMGKWCKYCPAFLSCPLQTSLQIDVTSADSVMAIEKRIPFESDTDAADAFDLLQRIKMLSTRLSAALYARAAERPIPLTDGKVLGPREKPGTEKLDGDIVYQVVKEMHGQSVADAAVVRTATKTRLKEALGYVAGKGQAAAMERGVLAAVKAAGGTKRESKTVVEVHDADDPTSLSRLNLLLTSTP